jgi:hypothetical protein
MRLWRVCRRRFATAAFAGFHCKHAIRVLGQKAKAGAATRIRSRLYDEALVQALTILWEAADRICGKAPQASYSHIGGCDGVPWRFGSGARGSRASIPRRAPRRSIVWSPPGHLGELVKDLLLLIPICQPIPSGDGLGQFSSACQTPLPPSLVARHL